MANRRMFSLQVVDTDAFLEMPSSSQLLYFHLAMRADDDGFVSNPKKILRSIGCQDDDLKVVLSKRFILGFESGIVVIKHWLIHNLIRHDRYTETQWVKEKAMLSIDEKTKKYSLNKGDNRVIPDGNQLAPQVRLGKVRLGKDINTDTATKKSQSPIENTTKGETQFNAKETRAKWYAGADETFSLLAWFFDKKNLWAVFDTREKVEASARRHLRAARRIDKAGWTQKNLEFALRKMLTSNPKMRDEWTLETLEKYLTK